MDLKWSKEITREHKFDENRGQGEQYAGRERDGRAADDAAGQSGRRPAGGEEGLGSHQALFVRFA